MNPAHYRRELLSYAKKRGWDIEQTKNQHYRLTHPRHRTIVFTPSSPSDHRSFAAVKTKMRRVERGLDEPKWSRIDRRP